MPTNKTIKKAEQRRISQIGDIKNRLGGIMELPSGITVRVRNPGGLQAFLSSGNIPNSLMTIIQSGMAKGKGISEKDLMPGGQIDPQLLAEMTQMMDQVALKVIIEPRVHPVPTEEDVIINNSLAGENAPEGWTKANTPEDLRRDDQLYVDEFPDDDKSFLFQWISGGTRDLVEFRKQLEERVATVSASTESANPS